MTEITDGPTELQIRQALVQSVEPFLTIKDLAELLDVTPRTIRNNIDAAVNGDIFCSRDVGQTTVYYKDSYMKPRFPRPPFSEQIPVFQREVLADRAEWLETRSRYYQPSTTPDVHKRVRLYYALVDYARTCGGLKYDPSAMEGSQILLDSDSNLTEEDVEHIDTEHEFFDASAIADVETDGELETQYIGEDGVVRGISGLLQHEMKVVVAVDSLLKSVVADTETGKEELALDDLPKGELDQIFPAAAEIVHAGKIIDTFTVALHGLAWSDE